MKGKSKTFSVLPKSDKHFPIIALCELQTFNQLSALLKTNLFNFSINYFYRATIAHQSWSHPHLLDVRMCVRIKIQGVPIFQYFIAIFLLAWLLPTTSSKLQNLQSQIVQSDMEGQRTAINSIFVLVCHTHKPYQHPYFFSLATQRAPLLHV